MTDINDLNRARYYEEARSWAGDRERQRASLLRLAFLIAVGASLIALFEAIALVVLMPLKTVEPYTILVDRQTGNVEALKPLDQAMIAPDQALTRSLLAQYVIAREGFALESVKSDYRKVALWSAGEARSQYLSDMRGSNPASPLVSLPPQAIIEVEIRSISSLGPHTSIVRFVKTKIDPGGQQTVAQPWTAIITYRFSGGAMSEADRLINPLGFQVLRYRHDAEMPTVLDIPAPAPAVRHQAVATVPTAVPRSQ